MAVPVSSLLATRCLRSVDVLSSADVATDGGPAGPLEAVLVRVMNPLVTDVTPPVGSGRTSAPTNEYVVDNASCDIVTTCST